MKRLFEDTKKSLITASLRWNERGEPSSTLFDDIYFSTANGLAETHYVFIEQNALVSRWQASTQAYYVIGETGFGSGLNMLVTWQCFKQFRQQHPLHPLKRLYFISFEKYPLTNDDLFNAHARWPELADIAKAFRQQYPLPVAGCHRMSFDNVGDTDGQMIVDLWFGDIKDTLIEVDSNKEGLIDTWFLDGFAPSKNPEMWNQSLYDNMAAISKNNACMATFTAAGDVRRGLIKAGFSIKKVKGFGKKREMITGLYSRKKPCCVQHPWFNRPALTKIPRPHIDEPIVIIGGGIASASIALALAKRQIPCTILCEDPQLACGASGNRQGGFYPLINPLHDHLSQFYCHAFSYAATLYQPFVEQCADNGDFCGVIQIAPTEKTRATQHKLLASNYFPHSLVHHVDAHTASEISGLDLNHSALFYPRGGWISPQLMTKALLSTPALSQYITVFYHTKVVRLTTDNDYWALHCANNKVHHTKYLVLANGHKLAHFSQTSALPFYATAGQVSHVLSSENTRPLKTLLCYQGYMTPASDNIHCIGASFNRDVSGYAVNEHEHLQNIEKLTSDLPNLGSSQSFNEQVIGGKVGIRLSVKDHLPMMGAVPNYEQTKIDYHDLSKGRSPHHYAPSPCLDNLFMIGGLGSRGLCSAPILGELLACQLLGEPMPMALSLLNQLNPNRYWIKQLKKHNVSI